ncbi:hypothetical protein OAF37_00450 [Rubripirellula sp.]|nr:hypothetical protein [Rubripirellula sp.]MDA7874792.1 hypothetical protein [Rhodopirellula sp.]MDB4644501.1 hypothetical protein [Rubripirellula sp.]
MAEGKQRPKGSSRILGEGGDERQVQRQNQRLIDRKERKSAFEISARLRRSAAAVYNSLRYGKEEKQIESFRREEKGWW